MWRGGCNINCLNDKSATQSSSKWIISEHESDVIIVFLYSDNYIVNVYKYTIYVPDILVNTTVHLYRLSWFRPGRGWCGVNGDTLNA